MEVATGREELHPDGRKSEGIIGKEHINHGIWGTIE